MGGSGRSVSEGNGEMDTIKVLHIGTRWFVKLIGTNKNLRKNEVVIGHRNFECFLCKFRM